METKIFIIIIVVVLTASVATIGYLLFILKNKKINGQTLEFKINEKNKILEQNNIKLEGIKNEILVKEANLKHLIDLENNENNLKIQVDELYNKSKELKTEIENISLEKEDLNSKLFSIKEDISIFEPKHSLINFGFFDEPEYLYETSDRFKAEIKTIREQQKQMIKNDKCVILPENVAITSNSQYAKKILQGQSELMIKAFNLECDNLMSIVKTSNYASILERIDKVAFEIEKSALSLKCGFSKEYIDLKFKECELQYQYKLKLAREQEEQDMIKERMREELKAEKEYEKAIAKAEKEEEIYTKALDIARKELEVARESEKAKFETRIKILELQLAEAEQNHQRALSMAQQTKRGFVYIISNIGSFGEDIYKIGLTRRLEPLERINELSGASVPFGFDVHAMIYSEDAPNLESTLHKEFAKYRVNQVNYRKEFFKINLLEIKRKAIELSKSEIDFKVTALAFEYYESLKLRENTIE